LQRERSGCPAPRNLTSTTRVRLSLHPVSPPPLWPRGVAVAGLLRESLSCRSRFQSAFAAPPRRPVPLPPRERALRQAESLPREEFVRASPTFDAPPRARRGASPTPPPDRDHRARTVSVPLSRDRRP